jgi:hypothetical protein
LPTGWWFDETKRRPRGSGEPGGRFVYARGSFRERDLQIASNLFDFVEIDAPVDEPVAVGANATQIPNRAVRGDAIRHVTGRNLWRAAGNTKSSTGTARLPALD